MIWIPLALMLATFTLAQMQRYGTAPGLGWLAAVLPYAFAGAAAWFAAALLLAVDMKPAVVAAIETGRAFEARHAGLVTALLAALGAGLACTGFARAAWRLSEALCERPENAYHFGVAGPAAMGVLGALLLALTLARL
ncbi:MAG: hypothetical protein ACK44F_07285 [Roseococcus sp.]